MSNNSSSTNPSNAAKYRKSTTPMNGRAKMLTVWFIRNLYDKLRPNRKFVSSFLGVSTSSYLEFRIKTFGLGWEVGRRYSDFIWLRTNLQRFYPTQMIPPIPNKKAHKRLPRQLEKRMRILTLFLNDLLAYP